MAGLCCQGDMKALWGQLECISLALCPGVGGSGDVNWDGCWAYFIQSVQAKSLHTPPMPRQQRTKIQEPAPPGVPWGSLSHTTGWRSQEAAKQAYAFCLSARSLASQVGALGETSAWIFSPLCLPGTYLTLWLADISLPCLPQTCVTFITCVCVAIFRG